MKKIFVFLLILLIVSTMLMACAKRDEEALISRDKVLYAMDMLFHFQFVVDGELHSARALLFVSPDSSRFDPTLTELVFVHSEEEAQGFPDNVIVAWPSVATENIVEEIQATATRRSVNFADFGLSDMLTVADLVDNWEKIEALWLSLGK